MKRLLYILLISFGFSATAQNASTIQQLLDEGVTIGELLDAGIPSPTFKNMFYGGGYIFDIDTSLQICKVVMKGTGSGHPWITDINTTLVGADSDNDGVYNTLAIAQASTHSIGQAALASRYNNYNDWYVPTISEGLKASELWFFSFIMASDNSHLVGLGSNFWTSQEYNSDLAYSISGNGADSPTFEIHEKTNNFDWLFIRKFDLNDAQHPTLNEFNNQLIEENLSNLIASPFLYGSYYKGGYIFSVDSINSIVKVVADYRVSGSIFQEDLINSLPYINVEGYNDWRLPNISEGLELAEFHDSQVIRDGLHSSLLSHLGDEFWTSEPELYINGNSFSSNNIVSIANDLQSKEAVIIREFDINSSSQLSPALESFLETYTPPVVEEEVVSDANSFDVLNPLSYNGAFESVHYSFMNGNYTVPSDKTLIIYIISNPTGIETQRLLIDDIKHLVIDCCQSNLTNDIGKPIIVGGNKTLSIEDYSSINISFHGVLVNTAFESVHIDVANSNYIVPNGKTLIVSEFCSENSVDLYADDNFLSLVIGGSALGDNNNTITYTFSGNTTISSNPPAPYFLHGILIDNSNYTYATDYELIDALNEGMDSLSTISEVVTQENDSLTIENAVLLEENEALMLIEYNYDSLQYVTEYLYSQVFDLQQELLVPNIDVDMAIGWNMIGFSCPEEKELTDALGDIVDEILIMKDNNGSVYMPEFGFNGIGNLTPGYGYQLKVTDYILDFNICE